jgi:hypothetical protein
MAITTYAELKAAAANWLSRSDLGSRIPEFVELAEAHFNRRLRVREQETSAGIAMAGGAGALPADYLQWREVKWPGSLARSLEYADRTWLSETFPDSPSAPPRYFTIEGTTISVMPVDNTSLTLRYYQKIPALSDAAPTNWLIAAHPDLYLFGTLTEAQGLIQGLDKGMVWKARRDELVGEIAQLAQKGKAPGEIRLQGVYAP